MDSTSKITTFTPPDAPAPRRFVFVLLDNFTMLCFSSAIECLRVANREAGQTIYDWITVGEGGEHSTCSAGISFRLDAGLETLVRGDTIVLCGGLDIEAVATKSLLGWLRRESRKGAKIGALCTAAHTMAASGLLDGHRATIHWENQDSFAEMFPKVELTQSVFVVDGDRFTAAGGTASIDLMLHFIASDHGDELAGRVADQLIYSAVRGDQDSQRPSMPSQIGMRHPKLAVVMQRMEDTIETPLSPPVLASDVGLSTRQLERLFRRYLNRSPKRYYMDLRLQKARNLLAQTDMSVINVALACGFTSPSHFSRCYRAHFNTTPYRERGGPSRAVTAIADV